MKKLLLVVPLIILVIIGCSVFKSPKLFIWGWVSLSKYYIGDSLAYVYGGKYGDFMSDPICDTATAKINDVVVETRCYEDGTGWFDDTLNPTPETEYKLLLDTDVGDANATCKVPGDFRITTPDSIGKNTALTVTWKKAKEAQWYYVEIYLESLPYYYDYKETTKVVTDTFFTIPANWITKEGYVDVYVTAGNGPKYQAGSKGNMKGDGKGFWIGAQHRYDYIRVDTPYEKEDKISRREPKQIMRSYLETIAPECEDAREILEHIK